MRKLNYLIISILLLWPKLAYATTVSLKEINLLEGKNIGGFNSLLTKALTGLTTIISTFAVLSMVYGGILYVTAHGSDEQIDKAKKFITLPLIGLIIASCAYIIVKSVVGILY